MEFSRGETVEWIAEDKALLALRFLLFAFDGGYTNYTVLKPIPPRTVCTRRIRKDAKLCLTSHQLFPGRIRLGR